MQYDAHATLPAPDEPSARHSRRVADFIHGEIAAAGGSIGFAEFMQHALYAPGLGYYTAGATKLGAAGDFITAPEVSPLFGRVLARQCTEVLAGMDDPEIIEIGAGSGKLAVDILSALADRDALPARYAILEVSADLRERQEALLRSKIPDCLPLVTWLDRLPERHCGVIVANEVIDALPVERFRRAADGIGQLRVASEGDGFRVAEAPAPDKLAGAIHAIEERLGRALPDGFVSEVSLGMPGWVHDIARCLDSGIAFLMDYGVARREYYAPERAGGWLRCHFRHHAHDDPLILLGIQDITAWVDFTAVAEAGVAHGLDVAGYTSQAHFLLGGGLEAELEHLSDLPIATQLETTRQVKMLTLPAEMGEHFKCLALRRGAVPVPSAFELADRTHTL